MTRITKKINWKKHGLILGAIIILTLTLVMTSAIWVNLVGMERSRIQEYRTLAQNVGQTSLTFVLLKQYDHLMDLMQLLTKTNHIQFMALYVDGERVLQAGEIVNNAQLTNSAKQLDEQAITLAHLPEQVIVNLSLNQDRNVDLGSTSMQIVFSLKDFVARKSNIITAIALILILLFGIIILFYIIGRFQQRLEKQNIILRATQNQLEHEELTKSEMIRAISHHAMQFLTAIYGKLFNLLEQRKAIVPKVDLIKSLKIIRENTDALKRTLENLKDNERLSKGQVKCLPKQLDLNNLVQLAGQSFEESLNKRGLTLTIDLIRGPNLVWADPEIVKPVMMNLLDNAIKFSPAGGKIKVELLREQSEFLVKVTDQGSGIAAKDWPRIFTSFVRLNPKIPGTGLGLSNARQLIQLQGGRLDIEKSEIGQGTTFYFVLPALVQEQPLEMKEG